MIDRVVLVIGASSGMGRESARIFVRNGARVMASARRLDRLESLRGELIQENPATSSLLEIQAADARIRIDLERLVEATLSRFGRIDVLVFAAGTNLKNRSLTRLNEHDFSGLIETNLTAAFHATQLVLVPMREQKGGLIIYLSSACVQRPDVSGVAYQASKHGLAGLAHGTRVEERENGIRTTVIYPGLCDTEILLQRPAPTPPEILEKSLRPEDVAQAVFLVASLPDRVLIPELQIVPSKLPF